MEGRVSMGVKNEMRTLIDLAKKDVLRYTDEIEILQKKIDSLTRCREGALTQIEECEEVIMALNRNDWRKKGLI